MPRAPVVSGQDWAPQVFNFQKKNEAGKWPGRVGESEASRILQSGGNVNVVLKEHHRANTQRDGPGANAKRIDEDSETTKVKRIDNSLRVAIQRARQEKNWTQQDLAQRIAERVGVVTEYENGKAVPEERVLVKMEKAFGIHLRGVKAGQPFGSAKPQPKKSV